MPAGGDSTSVEPKSLVWATEIDVLPPDRTVERRDGYLVIRSPSNPTHHWGNLLLFDDPPAAGDGSRWEAMFQAEIGSDLRVAHRTFGWDRADGVLGSARQEFVARGYHLEESVGLVAAPSDVRPHPRENRDVVVRALDPGAGIDDAAWEEVLELWVATRDERFPEAAYRAFGRARLADLRRTFSAGHGAWYVAQLGEHREIVASCGIVVTGIRARFQAVDTAVAQRRRGICSRLLVEAAHATAERHSTKYVVIVADAGYHALGLYESLGFERAERVYGVSLDRST